MIGSARTLFVTSRFARNTALMSAASILSQGVFLAASPILTRLFTPADFALLGLFTTLHALMLTWATGRVEWSVPNANHERDAYAMILAALGILCLSCLFLLLPALLLPGALFGAATAEPLPRMVLLLLPASIFLGGVQAILQSWYVMRGTMQQISLSRIALALGYVLAAISIGLIAPSGTALVICFALSHAIAALILIHGAGSIHTKCRSLSLPDIRATLSHFRTEIIASLGSSILHGISFYLMILLIWLKFDALILGWFMLVFRIAMAPVNLLTSSLSKGFWAEAADLAKRDVTQLRKLYLRVSLALCGPAIACAAVTLSAPAYFGTIFGEDWAGAGSLLAALTPMLLAMIVFSSTNHFIVYRRQHWQLYCDLTSILLMLLAFAVASALNVNAANTIWLGSMAYLVSYLLRFALHLRANTAFAETHGQRMSSME